MDKLSTLDFSSGHDLTVRLMGWSPASGCVLTAQNLLGILSLPLSAPLPLALSLSLSLSLKISK